MNTEDLTRTVRKHAKSNTWVIKSDAFFEKNVLVRGNLVTGIHVGFWGNLVVEGSLSLGNRSTIRGDVRADSAFIGHNAEIGGLLTTINDTTLLKGARLREVDSGGNIAIQPETIIDRIIAEGNVEISGKASIGYISTKGKVVVRNS